MVINKFFSQIFSVRVRDKGPDYRGFVQLPPNGNAILQNSGYSQEVFMAEGAKCFVESCQKLNRFSISVSLTDIFLSI